MLKKLSELPKFNGLAQVIQATRKYTSDKRNTLKKKCR